MSGKNNFKGCPIFHEFQNGHNFALLDETERKLSKSQEKIQHSHTYIIHIRKGLREFALTFYLYSSHRMTHFIFF